MSSGNPLDRSVTAIIATYNRARYIEQAVDSILAQQQPVAQLIVVDDGSDDDRRASQSMARIDYV
jgi:glycosyltransferase involved in cell wall biosynthesis